MATPAASISPSEAVARGLRGRKLDIGGIVFEGALVLALLISLGFLVILLGDVIITGMPVFQERGWDFLTSNLSSLPGSAGVAQGIAGSLLMMVFVVALAFPAGIGAAVYLEEYAKDTRFNRFITVNIRNLAGVPSIVFGLLGLAIFVQALGGFTGGRSIIAGGITLAVLVLPIVIITSSEALRAVPDSIREAGFGVGATRWEVIRHHVLPAAAPGVLTGTVLSLSRALGETAPIVLVGAVTGFLATGDQTFVEELRGPFVALPTTIFNWASLPQLEFRANTKAAILVLLAVILLGNSLAIWLRNRYERKW